MEKRVNTMVAHRTADTWLPDVISTQYKHQVKSLLTHVAWEVYTDVIPLESIFRKARVKNENFRLSIMRGKRIYF